ncbi:transketolase [Coprinellus micaceus]|uniref:Transketolase n=1 Tax=Coprinellus micaceus TaxID=71717 RepID=A0A4Y7R8S1_COPMI|nr:transketolase [Coprinellus micaceus]
MTSTNQEPLNGKSGMGGSGLWSGSFPIDLKSFKKLKLDPKKPQLSKEEKEVLTFNIQLLRGAYDTVPEVCMLLAIMEGDPSKYVPIIWDEAGHRVATQYLLSALDGSLPPEHLLHYRAANSRLPGHPELGLTPGVKFSSGRLGHMWPLVNGVALANRDKGVFCLGSDGSQQEGNDAEAARLAVAQNLNVKLFIDDNDVTIAGHPSKYLKGYNVAKTLEGHGMKVITAQGEDFESLWSAVAEAVACNGPAAVVSKRVMAPGIPDIEGSPHAHDVIPVASATRYLEKRGLGNLASIYNEIKPILNPYLFIGSSHELGANRVIFGEAVNMVLDTLPPEEAKAKVLVVDSDLEGSTGLKSIHQKHPEVFLSSGIMERGNFSAAAGFGFDPDKFGVFSTFSAFLEMVISELTMARLNNCKCMADNTCHFGLNNMFGDNGLTDVQSYLYFPADAAQMVAVVKRVFFERGVRFIFSTRRYNSEGKAGYVVSFGEMLYRSWDAVLRCRQQGLDVGLINKPCLNVIKKIGQTPFVLVVESLNQKTGLGSKFGTWLLERQLTPKYGYMGTTKEGCGGLWEQIPYQN